MLKLNLRKEVNSLSQPKKYKYEYEYDIKNQLAKQLLGLSSDKTGQYL